MALATGSPTFANFRIDERLYTMTSSKQLRNDDPSPVPRRLSNIGILLWVMAHWLDNDVPIYDGYVPAENCVDALAEIIAALRDQFLL